MGNYTREEVLQMAEDEDVEFIRLQFTDMFGTFEKYCDYSSGAPRALDNEYVVDSSYIAGIAGEKGAGYVSASGLRDHHHSSVASAAGKKVARLICDIYRCDGTPLEKSPRYILKQVVDMAAEEGYICEVDPECEFFPVPHR